jgi:hypothetical protein
VETGGRLRGAAGGGNARPAVARLPAPGADAFGRRLPVPGRGGDAWAVRAIIRQVESQRLNPARGPQTGVGEERAVYHAGRACLPAGHASHVARQLPTYQ